MEKKRTEIKMRRDKVSWQLFCFAWKLRDASEMNTGIKIIF